MRDEGSGLDDGSAAMVAQLDAMIGELEARGWLVAAAKAEEFVCAIYGEADVAIPAQRVERIEQMLASELRRTSSH